MAHWLVKEEPQKYSISDLEKDGNTCWDGIRNYQARNFLRQMKPGDTAIIFHTGKERAAVGMAKVTSSAYPDPSATEGDWSAVDLAFDQHLGNPVSLATIKLDSTFADSPLVRQGRLTVIPLTAAQFQRIRTLARA